MSSMLHNIESALQRHDLESAQRHLTPLALPVLLQWEAQSAVLRDGLVRLSWWSHLMGQRHPLIHERFTKSAARRTNATNPPNNVWRDLCMRLEGKNPVVPEALWEVPMRGARVAHSVADEFGVDTVHLVAPKEIQVIPLNGPSHRIAIPQDALTRMYPIRAWTVPWQDAVVLLLESEDDPHLHELVWINTSTATDPRSRDLSLWALSHNTQQESPAEFLAPPMIHGDPSLGLILLAGIEGACVAVTLRERETLLFDATKQHQDPPRHWRHLLSDELWEPHAAVTASCFVLDALLLYASTDGILRAHPRGNPHSVYHVEDMRSRVYQLTGLFNVVALIHSVDELEVRHVEKASADPFLRFRTLYRVGMVDHTRAPLLYGPYVVYRSTGLESGWFVVNYEAEKPRPLPVRVPHHAGWVVHDIKAANWRYWVLTMQKSHRFKDIFLFSAGAGVEHDIESLLVGKCFDCGAKATHVCGRCNVTPICSAHAEDSKHWKTPEKGRREKSHKEKKKIQK